MLASAVVSTLVGAPSIIGGPVCCLFDSPYLGLRSSVGAVGITANSETVIYSHGSTIFDFLEIPISTNLSADTSVNSYSHCGKWLNSAIVDPLNSSIVHGFFHQEWKCDYANNEYTNKSIGYAFSEDGGLTFTPFPSPSNITPGLDQIIAGYNTTNKHQTGEGDHSVTRIGNYLYLLFIDWDAPNDGISVGLARSPLSTGGRPGTWIKYFNNSFESGEPGIGGRSDTVIGAPGTAIAKVTGAAGGKDALVVVGVILSASMGISWANIINETDSFAPSIFTPASAGPLFNADWSNWDRSVNASELFGYPSLVSDVGSPDATLDPSQPNSLVFTYLAPRSLFTDRWLVRRPVSFFTLPPDSPLNSPPPPSLVTLSLWRNLNGTGTRFWPTSGPVSYTTTGNFTYIADIATLLTSNKAIGSNNSVELVECALGDGTIGAPIGGIIALTLAEECSNGIFALGSKLRTPGWILSSKEIADGLGWEKVIVAGSSSGDTFFGATSGVLYRCKGVDTWNYTVTFNDPLCTSVGNGWLPDRLLGYALSIVSTL